MAQPIAERMAGEITGEFVLFLIGARLNRPWKVSPGFRRPRDAAVCWPSSTPAPNSPAACNRIHAASALMMVGPVLAKPCTAAGLRDRTGPGALPASRDFTARSTEGRRCRESGTYLIGPGAVDCLYVNMRPLGSVRAGASACRQSEHRATPRDFASQPGANTGWVAQDEPRERRWSGS
jgi:hypothetical protein